jgi:hypothetical protein
MITTFSINKMLSLSLDSYLELLVSFEVSIGVGSKIIISLAYAAAILPESTEQSKQDI